MHRCDWCGTDPLYVNYHDREWGVPVYDSQQLFEVLVLETLQAGLSWLTILRKRDNLRLAFANFKPELIVQYDEQKVVELLNNPGIIRHRLKIAAIIANAKAYLKLQEEQEFARFIWQFTDGNTIQNAWQKREEVPVKTAISDRMAKALQGHGFKFVGSTTCYAYMQAVGLVNDHFIDCFRYQELSAVS